jgi:hypothetical protein
MPDIWHFSRKWKKFSGNNINSSFQKCPLGKKCNLNNIFHATKRALCSREKGTWQNLGGGGLAPRFLRSCIECLDQYTRSNCLVFSHEKSLSKFFIFYQSEWSNLIGWGAFQSGPVFCIRPALKRNCPVWNVTARSGFRGQKWGVKQFLNVSNLPKTFEKRSLTMVRYENSELHQALKTSY